MKMCVKCCGPQNNEPHCPCRMRACKAANIAVDSDLAKDDKAWAEFIQTLNYVFEGDKSNDSK